ncbi:MAG: hypothetical protein RBS24_07290, partial [Bacilli bacterium]|nr:hypothetical protein [Bacilli bacterium]
MLEFKHSVTKKNVGEFKGSSLYGKKHAINDKFTFLMRQHEEDNGDISKLEVVQLFEVEKERFLSEYEFVEKKVDFCIFKRKEI